MTRFARVALYVVLLLCAAFVVAPAQADGPELNADPGKVKLHTGLISFTSIQAPKTVYRNQQFVMQLTANVAAKADALAKIDVPDGWDKGQVTADTMAKAAVRFKMFDPSGNVALKNKQSIKFAYSDTDKGKNGVIKAECYSEAYVKGQVTILMSLAKHGKWTAKLVGVATAGAHGEIEKKKGDEWTTVNEEAIKDALRSVSLLRINVIQRPRTSDAISPHIGLKAIPSGTRWIEVWKLDEGGMWHQVPSFKPADQLSATNDVVHGDLSADGARPAVYRIKCCGVDGADALGERYLLVYPGATYQEFDLQTLPTEFSMPE